MVMLFRLFMLLFAMETAPAAGDDPVEDEPTEEDEEDEPTDDDDMERPNPDDVWKDIKDAAGVRRKMGALQDQVNRLHRKLEKQDKYIERLEGSDASADALNAARTQVAFLREAFDRTDKLDLEATWDLAGARGFLDTVKVNDDGEVEGMTDALDRVVERYPWLVEEGPLSDEDVDQSRPSRTASPPKKRRSDPGPNPQSMKARFPALARHGRG